MVLSIGRCRDSPDDRFILFDIVNADDVDALFRSQGRHGECWRKALPVSAADPIEQGLVRVTEHHTAAERLKFLGPVDQLEGLSCVLRA